MFRGGRCSPLPRSGAAGIASINIRLHRHAQKGHSPSTRPARLRRPIVGSMKIRAPKSAKKTPPAKKVPARAAKAADTATTPTHNDPKLANDAELATPVASEEKSPLEKGKSVISSPVDPVKSEEAAVKTAKSDLAAEDDTSQGKGKSPLTSPADPAKSEVAEGQKSRMEVGPVKIEEGLVKEEAVEVEVLVETQEEHSVEQVAVVETKLAIDEALPDSTVIADDGVEIGSEGQEVGVEDKEAETEGGDERDDDMEEPLEEVLAEDGGEDGVPEEEVPGVEEHEQIEISDMVKQRQIKKEREIFVGGLDRDATEDDVKKAFEKLGDVVEVRLHRDFATAKNKGFAFVLFSSKELADKALAEMKNPVIRGKRCGIAASEDNDTLFLGNICNTWTKEAIKKKLKDYGVEGVENITLVEDTQNEGVSRGFAFLEFSCHADAMVAYKRLQKPDVVFGHTERTAKVAFAEPLREPDAEVMAQVKSVFVDGMPPYWDEDRVKEQFKVYGEIERIVLARNMTTAKRKDFGFVNFSTHEAAIACIEGVNNTELGDGKSKAKVRVRLANPLPKTQAVKGGMRGGFRIGHTGVGPFSRFGRGFGRGRFQYNRGGFPGGRGFHPRGRGGRFGFNDNSHEFSHSHFRGRRPFVGRGGRRGGFSHMYDGPGDEFSQYQSRGGAFGSGRGRFSQSRRPSYPSEGEFGGNFDGWQFGDDPYLYGDVGHGVKRPFSIMEQDSGYAEHGRRQYPRYDYAEASGHRYRDMNQGAGNTYSGDAPYPEYYGSNTGSRGYSSFYGSDQAAGGRYY